MAKDKTFDDPLEDIDPVMEQAFSVAEDSAPAPAEKPVPTPEPVETTPVTDPTQPSTDDESLSLDADIAAPTAGVNADDAESAGPSSGVETDVHRPLMDESFEEDDTLPFAEEDEEEHDISEIQFPTLNADVAGKKVDEDVFSNIPVNISVELGRSKISLKEVFELTEGSIIELERLVGEPLDLVVNGQVIAQGEVVAIDNNYGLRITTVLAKSPA